MFILTSLPLSVAPKPFYRARKKDKSCAAKEKLLDCRVALLCFSVTFFFFFISVNAVLLSLSRVLEQGSLSLSRHITQGPGSESRLSAATLHVRLDSPRFTTVHSALNHAFTSTAMTFQQKHLIPTHITIWPGLESQLSTANSSQD